MSLITRPSGTTNKTKTTLSAKVPARLISIFSFACSTAYLQLSYSILSHLMQLCESGSLNRPTSQPAIRLALSTRGGLIAYINWSAIIRSDWVT
ncbi:hypothetical protein NXS19_013683 [Fusarium pseudograminearum]|nr:hypothetical protein NXS19_013683 [Fusarium pseudograminearum]